MESYLNSNSPIISFPHILNLLTNTKPLYFPILQIVYVNNSNLNVQNWYFSDENQIIRKKQHKDFTYKNIIDSFVNNAIPENQVIFHDLLFSSDLKICDLIKTDNSRQSLFKRQMSQILLSAVSLVSIKIIGFQQYVRSNISVQCQLELNIENKTNYDVCFDKEKLNFSIKHKLKAVSFRILSILLKTSKIKILNCEFIIDVFDRIFIKNITAYLTYFQEPISSHISARNNSEILHKIEQNYLSTNFTLQNTKNFDSSQKNISQAIFNTVRSKTAEKNIKILHENKSRFELFVKSQPKTIDSRRKSKSSQPISRGELIKNSEKTLENSCSNNHIIIKIPNTSSTIEGPIQIANYFIDEKNKNVNNSPIIINVKQNFIDKKPYQAQKRKYSRSSIIKNRSPSVLVSNIKISINNSQQNVKNKKSKNLVQIIKMQNIMGNYKKSLKNKFYNRSLSTGRAPKNRKEIFNLKGNSLNKIADNELLINKKLQKSAMTYRRETIKYSKKSSINIL